MFRFKTKEQLKLEAPQLSSEGKGNCSVIEEFYIEYIQTWVEDKNKKGNTELFIDRADFSAMRDVALEAVNIIDSRTWGVVVVRLEEIIQKNSDWHAEIPTNRELGLFISWKQG